MLYFVNIEFGYHISLFHLRSFVQNISIFGKKFDCDKFLIPPVVQICEIE